jgi:hypothetical protein
VTLRARLNCAHKKYIASKALKNGPKICMEYTLEWVEKRRFGFVVFFYGVMEQKQVVVFWNLAVI